MKFINNNKKELIGIATALFGWLLFTIIDFIDEYIINTGSCLGMFAVIIIPLTYLILYITHYYSIKPEFNNICRWFLTHSIVSIIIFFICIGTDITVIPQVKRSSVFDINGLEYALFGCTYSIGLPVLVLAFHGIRFMVRYIKTLKSSKSSNNCDENK